MIRKLGMAAGSLVFLFLVSVGVVRANEGTVVLEPEVGYEGECFVVSVFMDGSYRVLATCRNLPTALGAESNRLVLWREADDGKMGRIGELSRGKFYGTVRDKFVRLFVTSESTSSPKLPEGPILAQGNLRVIDFDGEKVVVAETTPTPLKVAEVTPVEVNEDSGGGTRVASIFVGIAKAVGLGFVLLLVVVGVLGFLSRRKGL